MYRNSEGYYDPTAGEALSRAMSDYKKERSDRRKAERKKDRQEKRAEMAAHIKLSAEEYKNQSKIYVVSPYAGDVAGNTSAAIRYCRYVIRKGMMPVASHLLYPQMLDDDIPEERELGLMFGLSLLTMCNEVWVFGPRISSGMEKEIAEANRLNKTIRYISEEAMR